MIMDPVIIFSRFFKSYCKFKSIEEANGFLRESMISILHVWTYHEDNVKCLRLPYTYNLYRKVVYGRYHRVACLTCSLDSSLSQISDLATLLARQCVTLKLPPAILFQDTKYLLYASYNSPETPWIFNEKNI